MRDWASHCLSFPFWYRERSRARPSSYSHVKRASPALGTSREYGSGTSVYLSLVVMRWRLSPGITGWSYDGYHIAPCSPPPATGKRGQGLGPLAISRGIRYAAIVLQGASVAGDRD